MKLKTINNFFVLTLIVLLLSINTASASWSGVVIFNGKASWNSAGVSGASVSVSCPTLSKTGSIVTDANGDYSVNLGYASYSGSGIPACTITVTHSLYETSSRSALVTVQAQNFFLTRLTATVSGSLSPASAAVSYSYNGDSAVNNCAVDSSSYSCTVNVAMPFTVSASATDYTAYSRNYASGINVNTADNINLAHTLVDVSATVSPLTTVLTITSGGTTCDGTEAVRTCHVYQGSGFTIQASSANYATQINVYAAGTSSVSISLTQEFYAFSLLIESFNGSPVNSPLVSMISGSGSCLGLTCTVYSGEAFSVAVSASDFNSAVYADTFTSANHPSSVSVKLHGTSYSLGVNVNEFNNDGSQVISTGSVIGITGEGTSCAGSNGVFTCSVFKGESFTLKAGKTGYTASSRVLILESTPVAPEVFSLMKGLRVNIADDFLLPVSEGRIELKTRVTSGATTTETLVSTVNIPIGNIGLSFYSLLNPADYPKSDDSKRYFKVYFYDGDNYLDFESAVTEIPDELLSQIQVSMGTYKTWRTNINVVDSISAPVTDYAISALNIETYGECHVGYCVLDQRAHTLTVSKAGYIINNSVVISALNNGSPVSVTMNKTLMVNVTDQNGNYASGLVSVVDNSNNVLVSGSLVDGVAWLAVDPISNVNVLSVQFTDSNYASATGVLNINSINSASTSYVKLLTRTLIKLTVNVTDYYTNNTLSGYSINAFNGSINYGTTNPLVFDVVTANPFVNISVSKEGYFSTVKEGQSINAGIVTIGLKPKVAVFLNTKANITVINTKKTSSTEDDDKLMTVETNNNSVASIPLSVDGLQFLLNISAVGFKGMILGPYESGSEIKIGSLDSRVNLESLTSGMPSGAPVILSISNYPENALTTNDVMISVRVSDAGRGNNTIIACNMKVDNNNYVAIGGNYNSYDITVSRNIGKLISGTHVLRVGCSDVDGWSEEGIFSFNVRVPAPANQTNNNTVVNNTNAIVRLSELMAKYALLAKTGLVTPEVKNALVNAENKINTPEAESAITLAENEMPLVSLMGSSNVITTKSKSPESVAKLIANRENQPYSVSELKGNLETVIFTKTAMKYMLNNEPKTVITLKVFSREANPDAFIADINPSSSSGRDTITTSDGVITYFMGLDAGENVFEYVVNGDVSNTAEPVVFTMKELSSAEKTIKGITGFSISIPGLFDVPIVYVGIGIVGLIFILKILI